MDSEAEKTIFEIFTVIQSDAELETFDVILEPNKTNESPVRHVQHHLGLESWCIKNLYSHVHRKIFARTSEPENQIKLLTTASLLNPCVKTFWNMRKKLILKCSLDLYSELRFVAVVLSFKPKVQDLFNHRKWILQEIFKRRTLNADLFYNELEIVQNAANRHVNNHMAWDFATWLLDRIELDSEPEQVLQTYWTSTQKWISCHVSDFSAMHFRQQLIKKLTSATSVDLNFRAFIASSCNKYHRRNLGLTDTLLADGGNDDLSFVLDVVLNDFELTENLISFYANHEALWTHIRFLCFVVVKVLPEKLSNDETAAFSEITSERSGDTKTKYDSPSFSVLFRKLHESFLSNVSVNNAHSYVQKHQEWLRHFGVEV